MPPRLLRIHPSSSEEGNTTPSASHPPLLIGGGGKLVSARCAAGEPRRWCERLLFTRDIDQDRLPHREGARQQCLHFAGLLDVEAGATERLRDACKINAFLEAPDFAGQCVA